MDQFKLISEICIRRRLTPGHRRVASTIGISIIREFPSSLAEKLL